LSLRRSASPAERTLGVGLFLKKGYYSVDKRVEKIQTWKTQEHGGKKGVFSIIQLELNFI
jgi:hypothetical protein